MRVTGHFQLKIYYDLLESEFTPEIYFSDGTVLHRGYDPDAMLGKEIIVRTAQNTLRGIVTYAYDWSLGLPSDQQYVGMTILGTYQGAWHGFGQSWGAVHWRLHDPTGELDSEDLEQVTWVTCSGGQMPLSIYRQARDIWVGLTEDGEDFCPYTAWWNFPGPLTAETYYRFVVRAWATNRFDDLEVAVRDFQKKWDGGDPSVWTGHADDLSMAAALFHHFLEAGL